MFSTENKNYTSEMKRHIKKQNFGNECMFAELTKKCRN